MQTLIINLASETARMDFQRKQMEALSLDWERLEAVTPPTLSVPPEDPRWQRWQRPLRAVEVAILASHVMAWERVIAARAPRLIVEDDAMLAAEVPMLLRQLENETGLDHVTLEVRNQKKLVGGRHSSLPIWRLYQDRSGAAAYVLWPSGAQILCSRATTRPALADAIIATAYELRSWQADPALALQLDKCRVYGISPPMVTTPSGTTEFHSRRSGLHRARRIAGQLRLGLRYLAKRPISNRRRIPLTSDWPLLNATRDF